MTLLKHDSFEQDGDRALMRQVPTASEHGCAKIACVETARRLIYDADPTRRTRNGLDNAYSCRNLHWARDERLSAGRVLSPDALASVLNWGASPPSYSARRRVGVFRNGTAAVRSVAWRGRETRACGRARRRALPSAATVRAGS